jgi:hypothetical protein
LTPLVGCCGGCRAGVIRPGLGPVGHEPGRCTWELGELIVDVPPRTEPTGFGAWFEVYLDGASHTFDARKQPPPRRPLVVGRDATRSMLG